MTVTVVGEDPTAVKEVTCRHCAARLRYVESDVFVHRYSACGQSESDSAIKCPQCAYVVLVR